MAPYGEMSTLDTRKEAAATPLRGAFALKSVWERPTTPRTFTEQLCSTRPEPFTRVICVLIKSYRPGVFSWVVLERSERHVRGTRAHARPRAALRVPSRVSVAEAL